MKSFISALFVSLIVASPALAQATSAQCDSKLVISLNGATASTRVINVTETVEYTNGGKVLYTDYYAAAASNIFTALSQANALSASQVASINKGLARDPAFMVRVYPTGSKSPLYLTYRVEANQAATSLIATSGVGFSITKECR